MTNDKEIARKPHPHTSSYLWQGVLSSERSAGFQPAAAASSPAAGTAVIRQKSELAFFYCAIALLFFCSTFSALRAEKVCIIVTGLGGMPEYEENFVAWGAAVEKMFRAEGNTAIYNLDGRRQERKRILHVFRQVSSLRGQGEVWLFLIGHGNYDGLRYRFHISGPDLTDENLQSFLNGLGERKAYVIAATSASGVLIRRLSKQNRVIVTATKNQFERQPPLFLTFFIEGATSARADSDKNGKISLLEGFLFARRGVASWFREAGRLQTEHPLLDDNGDGIGAARPGWENGEGFLAAAAYLLTPSKKAYQSLQSEQLAAEKRQVERKIQELKYKKKDIPESDYYPRLEDLLIQLATLNEKIESLEEKK